MLNAPRSSDFQSKWEPWIDTVILTGAVIVIVTAGAAVLDIFHNRHLPIQGTAPWVSTAGSTTSHSKS